MTAPSSPLVTYIYLESGLLALRVIGDWTSQTGGKEIAAMVASLAGKSISKVFVDLSGLTSSDAKSVNVTQDAMDLQRVVEQGVQFAFYAHEGSLGFGMSRILAAFSDPENKSRLQVWSDADSALESLGVAHSYTSLLNETDWSNALRVRPSKFAGMR